MKVFGVFFGIVVAGSLGYLMEPNLRMKLTGQSPQGGVGPLSGLVSQLAPPAVDFSLLSKAKLPEKVALKEAIETEQEGISVSLPVGTLVKLERVEGENALVRPSGAPYMLSLSILKTDLMERLNVPEETSGASAEVHSAPRPVDAKPVPVPVPATPSAPEKSSPAPAEVILPVQMPPPAPAPVLPVVDSPAPEPANSPAVGTEGEKENPSGGATSVVDAMKESLRSGQVKSIAFEQVTDWQTGVDETVGEEVFQVGIVSCRAETRSSGVQTINAKAFVKNGKVCRWVWLRSGTEVK